MIYFYIGGVKSGKSRHAEAKALTCAAHPVYLATAELFDDEMQDRAHKHRLDRGEAFTLIEEPRFILEAVQHQKGAVLLECITLWLNNMLYHNYKPEIILEQIDKLLDTNHCDLIIVQNDVGSGIIAGDALSRDFVDLSGIISQKIAARADEVFHCIAGIATRIK